MVPRVADGQEKPHRSLTELGGLMRDIGACRADLLRRETAIADLQRRLLAELQPLQDAMLEARVDTFRALGKHLRAGRLNKRASKTLELALYDLANALEAESGIDLRADRGRIFENDGAEAFAAGVGGDADGGEEDNEGDGDDAGGAGAYREADFENGREGRGEWAERRPRDRQGAHASQGGSRDEALAGDIRALYLMLARALHPDKESDPARLAEKTAWLQKVTAAYAARDLARLLDILAANPLDAVGPYLLQAPLKTVQGFAKRLRRELGALRLRLAQLESGLDPLPASLMKHGAVNEIAYSILLSQAKKDLKFMKQRRDMYRTTQGLEGLVDALRSHDWRELM